MLAGCWPLALAVSQGPGGEVAFFVVIIDFEVLIFPSCRYWEHFGDFMLPRNFAEETFVTKNILSPCSIDLGTPLVYHFGNMLDMIFVDVKMGIGL